MRFQTSQRLALAALGGGIALAALVGVLCSHEAHHIKAGVILASSLLAALLLGRETPPPTDP